MAAWRREKHKHRNSVALIKRAAHKRAAQRNSGRVTASNGNMKRRKIKTRLHYNSSTYIDIILVAKWRSRNAARRHQRQYRKAKAASGGISVCSVWQSSKKASRRQHQQRMA